MAIRGRGTVESEGGGYLLVHPSVNPLIGRIDAEREMSNKGEEAEGQVVETPTADGAREIEKELFHHHNGDRVPKCKDAPVDNLIGGWERGGGWQWHIMMGEVMT